jgi:hypothetical protein
MHLEEKETIRLDLGSQTSYNWAVGAREFFQEKENKNE